jgi:CHAD domain-containing protein
MAKAREIVGLECAAAAHAGIVLVLRTRLDEMCDFRAAALDWTDAEGVHDMRVASRRLRGALSDFAPYLGGRWPRTRLRKLARRLGAVRDEDVKLETLAELAQTAAPELRAGLRRIAAAHEQRREQARATLAATALDEAALERLRLKFLRKLERAALRHEVDDESQAQPERAATLSFKDAGREIICARLAKLLDQGVALYQPNDVKQLHRLRIATKRLRYALELYAPCWQANLSDTAKEVASLQKALGGLHDCDVWLADLGARLERLHARALDAPAADERRAGFWLMQYFAQARTKHYTDALECWSAWQAADLFARLRADLAQTDNAHSTNVPNSSVSPTDLPVA